MLAWIVPEPSLSPTRNRLLAVQLHFNGFTASRLKRPSYLADPNPLAGSKPMQHLSKAEECRDVAAQYGSLAKGTADPVRKSEYEVLEAKWLRLACRLDAPAANRENIIPFTAPKPR